MVNLPEECRLQGSDAGSGVGVAIARQNFPNDVIFNELQRPSRCSVVTVYNWNIISRKLRVTCLQVGHRFPNVFTLWLRKNSVKLHAPYELERTSPSIVIALRSYEIKSTYSIKVKKLSLCSIKYLGMKTHGYGGRAPGSVKEVSGFSFRFKLFCSNGEKKQTVCTG